MIDPIIRTSKATYFLANLDEISENSGKLTWNNQDPEGHSKTTLMIADSVFQWLTIYRK